MMKIEVKTKEVDISLEYTHELGSKPRVTIQGEGDLSHHLIEGLFDITDKLAQTNNCCHRKEDK